MINNKAIGYITANYTALKQETLLESRPIASVPVMGRYRLIDFPLSNMANAGIKTVGLVMPGNYRSIIDHVGHGKDWGLDRKRGGLFPLPGNPYGTTKAGMRFLLRDIISNKTLSQRIVLQSSTLVYARAYYRASMGYYSCGYNVKTCVVGYQTSPHVQDCSHAKELAK